MEATISADIIRSTSLPKEGMIVLQERLSEFVQFINKTFDGCWGRVVRGDGIECAIADAHYLLRIVMLLKCQIKEMRVCFDEVNIKGGDSRFFKFGVRMAVAIGRLRTNDKEQSIMDGEAIYNSGRALANMGRYDFFYMSISRDYERTEPIIRSLFLLINHIMKRASARQSQALFMKLQNMTDLEIAQRMRITRIGVYLHLKSIGWDAISTALRCYETMNF